MSFRAGLLAATLCLAALPAGAVGEGWAVRDQFTTPEGVKALCADLDAADVETLLAQVRGRADAYYRSDFVPRAEALGTAPPDFDPLEATLAACGPRRVVAWINTMLLWGGDVPPQSERHVVRAHPEWLLRDGAGKSTGAYDAEERARGWIEGPYADPADPGYRAHLAAVAAELARKYPVAGVHLDFIRYPGPDYGQAGPLGARFAAAYGLDPRLLPAEFGGVDLARWLADDTPASERFLVTAKLLWAELRAGEVTATVRAARAALADARPGVELSAAVFPDPAAAFLEKGQDWLGWAEEGLVDALYPMAYFGKAERVTAQLQTIRDAVRAANPAVAVRAGLGAYLKEPADIAREALAAQALGFDGVALFDVGSLRRKGRLAEFFAALPPFPRRESGPVIGKAPGDAPLMRAFRRAAVGAGGLPSDADARVLRREADFVRALPAAREAAQTLEREGVLAPSWGELRGVFRFVHPLDAAERKEEQRAQAEAARTRLLAGEPIDKVAGELSQDATKAFGGRLGRVYARGEGLRERAARALSPGQVSEVMEAANGFWVFRLDEAGSGGKMSFDDAPLTLRRAAFREALEAALAVLPPSTKVE